MVPVGLWCEPAPRLDLVPVRWPEDAGGAGVNVCALLQPRSATAGCGTNLKPAAVRLNSPLSISSRAVLAAGAFGAVLAMRACCFARCW